jgi:signal transduction histidine kinase
MTRTHAYWTCQIGGWTLYVTISFFVIGLNADEGFSTSMLLNHVATGVLGIGVTHAFRLFVHRVGWTDLSLRRLVPRLLGATAVMSVLYLGLTDALAYVGAIEIIAENPEEYWTFSRVVLSLFGSSIVMGLWLVIYFGVHAAWNYRQAEVDKWKLEAQAETARLKALKLQLNPHFFFNSLNSVRALIAEDPDRAQRMVTRLARLLRSTLQVDDVKTVPLEEELDTVRTYLELETVRFEERLQYEIDAGEAALGRPVPFLLVQTLVENGIKHGVAERQDGGTITIAARVADDALQLQVTNPGTLESEEGGVGLQNARERLGLLFGDEAALTLEQADANTVVATAVLPPRPGDERPTVRPAPTTASVPDAE